MEIINSTREDWLKRTAEMDAVRATVEPIATPTTCQAIKLKPGAGYRLCGSPLREGKNGFRSCSDMFCQIPVESWHKYDHLRRHLR